MSVSSESAEQLTRICLDETQFILKISGVAAEKILVALYVALKDKSSKTGRTQLKNMMKSDKELKVFSISKKDMKIFATEAKRYGILYCALYSKEHQKYDNMIDIMVKADDSSRVNRIVDRFNITTVDKAKVECSEEKEKAEQVVTDENQEINPESEDREISNSEIDDIFSKPKETEVPLDGRNQEIEYQSKDLSMNKEKFDEFSNFQGRKSVREELAKIKEERKVREELEKKEKELANKIPSFMEINEKLSNEIILKSDGKEKLK